MTSLGTDRYARVSIIAGLGVVRRIRLSVSVVCLSRVRAWSERRVRAPREHPRHRARAVRERVRCALCDARGSDRVGSGQDIDHPTLQSLSRISARESTQVRHRILRARDAEARFGAHTYRAILCARHRGCRRVLKFENSNMLFSSFTAAAEDIEDVLDLEFMNEALLQGWSNEDKDNRSRNPRCLIGTSESSEDQRAPCRLLSR